MATKAQLKSLYDDIGALLKISEAKAKKPVKTNNCESGTCKKPTKINEQKHNNRYDCKNDSKNGQRNDWNNDWRIALTNDWSNGWMNDWRNDRSNG